jgi:hypothetical protein
MKSRIGILFFLFLLFVLPERTLFAQNHVINGRITDAQNRQPLAFVNIIVNDGLTGTMSDIDGKYEVTASEPIQKIKFSCLGYETKEVDIQPDAKKCNIALKPVIFELQEVTIEAGENPAHRIIDSLLAHRKANNPNSLDSYRYKIYDQMVLTIDSSDFGKAMIETGGGGTLQMFDNILKKSDLMVMETASEVLFKAPDRKLQKVLGTKVAGMKDPTFIYLVNSMQSISFYDESINITGTNYVNPISRDSKRHYFFTLESISPIGQGDSLYVISFHPMRGSTFNGLRGTMTVNSDGWALQSVKASPNETGGVYTANIQQLYQKIGNQWFPKQLNTNLRFPGITFDIDGNSFPSVAIGKSYLTDIEINPDLSKQRFSDLEIVVDPIAAYRDETFWNGHRIDSLTERIRATYILVDSLTQGTNIFDRVLGFTDKLMNEDAIPIGLVNLDLNEILKLSRSRGWRFGLGLITNDRLSRHIRIHGFFGYWTKMKDFDYGGGIKWLIDRQKQMELDVKYSHMSEALGEFFLQEHYGLLTENDYKYGFYENVNVRSNRLSASFSTRTAQHFKLFLNLSGAEKRYLMPPFDSLPATRFATAEVKLRFAYKEKFLSKPDGIQSLGTIYPVVWLSYMHSFPNIFGSTYEFDRIKLEASQNFYTHYMGVSKVLLQAGYATQSCPIMETFNILGSYEPFGLYSPGSFSTMREDEFFCDRFVALYLSHNFSGMLWKTDSKWFKPELTLATNIGWGDMRHRESLNELNLKTMNKGFFESGFVVKGLLNVMWVKMGLGAFYRYGPYAFDKVWDNFAFKMSITFDL